MSTKKLVIILVILLVFRLSMSLIYAYVVNNTDGTSSKSSEVILVADETPDISQNTPSSEELANNSENISSSENVDLNAVQFATPVYSELPFVRRYSYNVDEAYDESIVTQFNSDVNDYFACINDAECNLATLETIASSFLSYEDYYKNYDKYIVKEINLLGSEVLKLVEAINAQDVSEIEILLQNINSMIANISKEINNEENLS